MKVIVAIILAVVCTVITGFVLMYGWNLFIQPIGVMKIGFWQTLGILTMYSVLTAKPNEENRIGLDEFIKQVMSKIIVVFLGFVFMFIYNVMQVN